MTEKPAKGLLAVWADVDEDYRTEYQKWHNCQHMTERVSIPGFHVGRRYQGIGEAPEFLMYYETDDSRVMASEPYLNAINNPTPWTREAITHLKNLVRAIYALDSSEGKRVPTEAPYIHLVRFNVKSDNESEVLQWFRESNLKGISGLSDVYSARLYKMDDEVSNITTEERKIHGGGPGQQKFMAFYEIASLDLPGTRAWKQALDRDKGKERLKKLADIQGESYWLDFTMYAPKSQYLP